MNKCSKCGRLLNENESDLCPACESDKAHKIKRWAEGVIGTVIIGGALIFGARFIPEELLDKISDLRPPTQ
jgi:ABC-type ATPase with predicted acetyltransferase domain